MALTTAAEGATAAVSLERGTEDNRPVGERDEYFRCVFTFRSRACSVIPQIPIPRFDLFRAGETAPRFRPRRSPHSKSGVKNGVPLCAGQLHRQSRL